MRSCHRWQHLGNELWWLTNWNVLAYELLGGLLIDYCIEWLQVVWLGEN